MSQIKIFKKQLKGIPYENIISLDETSTDTHLKYSLGWSKKGSKKQIPLTNKKIRYTMITSISNKKIIHNKIIKNSCNGDIFFDYIKELVKKLPKDKHWFIILDNARIHHYKIIKEYISNINNVSFIYNVPYSPETNPIEHVFNDFKRILKNTKYDNTNIITKINECIKLIKTKNFINYFINSLTYY